MSLVSRCGRLSRPALGSAELLHAPLQWKIGTSLSFSNGFTNGAANGINGARPSHSRGSLVTSPENKTQKKDVAGGKPVTSKSSNLVQGSTVDHAVDLMSLRPGDRLDIPYELTVSETLQEFWHAAFYSQDRIHTSRPFCRNMGLQDRVLPFSLALFLVSDCDLKNSELLSL